MKHTDSVARGVGIFSVLFAGLSLANPYSGVGHSLLWLPKLIASAFAPLLAVIGVLGALAGFRKRDYVATGLGIFGATLAARHVAGVSARRDGFSQAFGLDWKLQIPANLRAQFLPRQWQPIIKRPPRGRLQRDLVYGINLQTRQPLRADILQPPPGVSPTGLAMIYVHGGAWLYGSKNIDRPMFYHLAAQGHVMMTISYTLAPHTTIPEMVMDVKRAVLWLKRNASTYHIDPERIVLTGQSAGAHLSFLAAYAPDHPAFQPPETDEDAAVRAMVSFYGPTDLTALHYDMQARFGALAASRFFEPIQATLEQRGYKGNALVGGVPALVGGEPDEVAETYRLLSPVSYVRANCPPTLLLHGRHDVLVNVAMADSLYLALKKAGAPVVYVSLPGCDHTFDSLLPRISPPAQTAVYHLERFLALMV